MNIWAAGLGRSNTYTLWDVLGQQASQSESTPLLSQLATQSQSSIQDELTLSAAGQAAADSGTLGLLGTSLFPWMSQGSNGSIQLQDVKKYCDQQRTSLNSRIKEELREAGIDTGKQIRLQSGYDGSVVVANDHPQRAEIEQIFKDNPKLRDQFVEVDAMTSFVRAGEEGLAFQKAYAKDPYKAVAEYSYLFDGSPRPQFSLLVEGDQLTVEFV